MGRTSSYCKQTLIALLVYFLALTPTLVFAAGKNYNVKTIVYDPLEKVIQATTLDRIAEKTMQRTARVPVTASATGSTVASMIRLGVAGAVIYGIVEGVGWVIENGIVYKKEYDPNKPYYGEKVWKWDNFNYDKDAQVVCQRLAPSTTSDGSGGTPKFLRVEFVSITRAACVTLQYGREGKNYIDYVNNPNYNPDEQPKKTPVSETELGDKVNNSPQAPQILPTVYNPNSTAGGTAPKITADAIDRAVPVPETEPEGTTVVDPETGKGTFKLPAFCEWASVMCAWYEKYQDDSKKTDEHREIEKEVWKQEKTAREEEKQHREDEKGFWQKVEDWFKKWDDTPEQNDDTEVDVDQPENQNIDTTINFGGSCPQPISVPYSFAGASGTIEFSYEPLCQIASFIKPVVITVASFSAALIIGGIRTEDD